MRLQKPVSSLENIIFKYSSAPFKKEKDNVGLMQPFIAHPYTGAFIYVHPNLSEKYKLEISAHEALHAAYPDLTEKQVIYGAEMIAHVVWLAGFRKTKRKTKQKKK